MPQRVTVVKQDESGRNKVYRDNYTGEEMSRPQFVKRIEQGDYAGYHIREIDGVKTPVSNPDDEEDNNLG